ncbi:hypothetical protein [Bifidobacterium oedipodis]|uniref:MerR family transcriptional regulator n=1 Tax=Bifidobacterium oedipodis TaxID=2675322 RepID=A0A7Y0HSJ8_9BIFI|nr:hypothetical protein [Bifidobacterium sp. DSM 109957]NMM94096.1 MerR family transcriptional regulator [Bifidobacterium sp. DSM 109957]
MKFKMACIKSSTNGMDTNSETGRRTVDVVDAMDYQRQERERMRASLSAMRQAAQEIAMNDDELASYVAQFD